MIVCLMKWPLRWRWRWRSNYVTCCERFLMRTFAMANRPFLSSDLPSLQSPCERPEYFARLLVGGTVPGATIPGHSRLRMARREVQRGFQRLPRSYATRTRASAGWQEPAVLGHWSDIVHTYSQGRSRLDDKRRDILRCRRRSAPRIVLPVDQLG